MSQEAFLAALDAGLTAACIDAGLGDAAVYTPPGEAAVPVPCSVLVDQAVQFFGDSPADIVGTRTVVRFLAAEIGTPARNATLAVGSRSYLLEREIDNEPGISSRWVVRHA